MLNHIHLQLENKYMRIESLMEYLYIYIFFYIGSLPQQKCRLHTITKQRAPAVQHMVQDRLTFSGYTEADDLQSATAQVYTGMFLEDICAECINGAPLWVMTVFWCWQEVSARVEVFRFASYFSFFFAKTTAIIWLYAFCVKHQPLQRRRKFFFRYIFCNRIVKNQRHGTYSATTFCTVRLFQSYILK